MITAPPNPAPPGFRPRRCAEAGTTGYPRTIAPTALLVASLLAIPLIAGCGGGGAEGREAVSGTVTMNGAPLHDATIEFSPLTQGVSSFGGATIIEGEYSISANRGLVPGEYKVVISMAGSTPEPSMDEPPGDPALFPPAPELIPAKYSSESSLTATVEAGGANTFDFDLQK